MVNIIILISYQIPFLKIIADVLIILETMGVKLHKDCISVVFDSKGDSYEVPNYCINLPHKYNLKDQPKKKSSISEETLKVMLYLSLYKGYN